MLWILFPLTIAPSRRALRYPEHVHNPQGMNGGALYASITVNISDSSFTDCYAEEDGGALYINATLNLTDSTFINCRCGMLKPAAAWGVPLPQET